MLRSSVIQLAYSAVSLLAKREGDRSLSAINATMGIVKTKEENKNEKKRGRNRKNRRGGLGEETPTTSSISLNEHTHSYTYKQRGHETTQASKSQSIKVGLWL